MSHFTFRCFECSKEDIYGEDFYGIELEVPKDDRLGVGDYRNFHFCSRECIDKFNITHHLSAEGFERYKNYYNQKWGSQI